MKIYTELTQKVTVITKNAKDMSQILAHQHRYLASQNIDRPVEKVYHIDNDILQYALEQHLDKVSYVSNVKIPFANQQITYLEFNR